MDRFALLLAPRIRPIPRIPRMAPILPIPRTGHEWETPIAPDALEKAVFPDKWKPRSTCDEVHPIEEWTGEMPQERSVRHGADTSMPPPPRDDPSVIQEDGEAIPARNSFCGNESYGHRIPEGFHRRYCNV